MCKRIVATLSILLITSGLYVATAQQSRSGLSPKKEEGYLPYTYTAKYYGFITSTLDVRQGYKASAESIRMNVMEKGAKYVLYNAHSGRLALDFPPEKIAPYAGQRVFIYGSTVSKVYGSGPTATEAASGGFASSEPRSTNSLKVITITATNLKDAYDPYVAKAE